MNEPAVSVKSLTKSFGTRKVVDDLSFDVQKGEVFALLGHNGAGKSTTIDLILGLKVPEAGSAKILGMDAAKNRKQVFERVGVQLQHTRYQSSITVEEACIEYASLYAAPADYPQLLEQFGLLTTHYMEEAEALCDRVYIIKSGKKVAEGTVDEVIAASGRKDLEEAYLFFMGEEDLL